MTPPTPFHPSGHPEPRSGATTAAVARRCPPPRPSRPGSPRSGPWLGIEPARLPLPFPLPRDHPRAPGRRPKAAAGESFPSPVLQCEGRKGMAILPKTPPLSLYFLKEHSTLLPSCRNTPPPLVYLQINPLPIQLNLKYTPDLSRITQKLPKISNRPLPTHDYLQPGPWPLTNPRTIIKPIISCTK